MSNIDQIHGRPKLLMACAYFWPAMGGLENYVRSIAIEMQLQGWDVALITANHRVSEYTLDVVDGISVHRLPIAFKVSNTPIGIAWPFSIRKIIRQERPDVIDVHMPVPYIADVTAGVSGEIPVVVTYHNDLVKGGTLSKAIAKLANRTLVRHTLKESEKIIVTSNEYAMHSEILREWLHKVEIVPPGVDTKRFNPGVSGLMVNQQYPDDQLILFVGAITKGQQHKGLRYLIQAFAYVHSSNPHTKLLVVGGGDGRDIYADYAHECRVAEDVIFLGHVSDDDLPSYYAAATVHVLPSTNRSEGFGMVLLEASSSGTPVIGTDVGGIPAAVKDGVTGLLVPPEDVAALSGAMRRILGDADLAKRLGDAGVEHAQSFSWAEQGAKTASILRSCLHK